ncbi:tetratricopeptide repeat protein [uncultured Cohaesibacter sp.]|uniref:tetratricopeptide repeat protein n=1 Tax=uncultured Cohaesibacter sp. TaxID=1002546 RepID=UPI002931429D|nr:tetratricopeptide repeat protein [uncultured Cohaesibacter sp.]
MKRQKRFALTLARGLSLAFAVSLAGVTASQAFDPRTMQEGGAKASDAFVFGFQAYKLGDTSTAVEALKYAAKKGHMPSQWKLGRMYEEGDGVHKDPAQAFDLFNDIAKRYGNARPGSVEARYVADAIVMLSEFVRSGIPGKVVSNPKESQELLLYAASYFRDPEAQYHLALSYLDKSVGEVEPRMASRWLVKAARKNHVGAQLKLGEMLLDGQFFPPQPVNGLKWLTIARMLDSGNPEASDRQEAAFALADQETRQKAVSLADQWVNGTGR